MRVKAKETRSTRSAICNMTALAVEFRTWSSDYGREINLSLFIHGWDFLSDDDVSLVFSVHYRGSCVDRNKAIILTKDRGFDDATHTARSLDECLTSASFHLFVLS